MQWRQSGLKSWIRVLKKIDFSKQIFENFEFFSNFTQEIWFFPGKFLKNFNFFSGNFTKNFNFPGKNWSFTATSGKFFYFSSKVTTFVHTSCTCTGIRIKSIFPSKFSKILSFSAISHKKCDPPCQK